MNQTKKVNVKKTKKKTIEQSSIRKGSPMEGVGSMANSAFHPLGVDE